LFQLSYDNKVYPYLSYERGSEPLRKVFIHGHSPEIVGAVAAEDGYHNMPVYIRFESRAFANLCLQLREVDMAAVLGAVTSYQIALKAVRRNGVVVEPLHVQFVGPPRQGKTLFCKHIVEIMRTIGLGVVSRSCQDSFFDDVASDLISGAIGSVDVLHLDELFSGEEKSEKDAALLLNGIVPFPWKPLIADPKMKGLKLNPVLWMTTTNHEVVDHKHDVEAIRDRVHRRYLVFEGHVYSQECYKKLAPNGNYKGGFRTCAGKFGASAEHEQSQSLARGRSQGPPSVQNMGPLPVLSRANGNVTFRSQTVSNRVLTRLEDLRMDRPCTHCKKLTLTNVIVEMLEAAVIKASDANTAHLLMQGSISRGIATLKVLNRPLTPAAVVEKEWYV
jgi:hypothetical protein